MVLSISTIKRSGSSVSALIMRLTTNHSCKGVRLTKISEHLDILTV